MDKSDQMWHKSDVRPTWSTSGDYANEVRLFILEYFFAHFFHLSVFFAGQPGCETDTQCLTQTNGTHCVKGYCVCSVPLLIHESKCVMQCPEGFLNIAGRCHDLTSIVFMDSVEMRENGTIGGFCLATVIEEERCLVKNAYCSEKSLTCQCRPGYELRIEDIRNRTDMVTMRTRERTFK